MWQLALCTFFASNAPAKDPVQVVLEVKGYVLPVREVAISPKVGGMIVKLNVVEGQRVKKGEVLARLDDTDCRLDLAHAEAKLQLTKARRANVAKDAKGDRDVLDAEAAVAMVEVEKARHRLDATTVVAPWNGTILSKHAEEGAIVSPSNGIASRICTMADLTELEVDVAIAERDIHKIAVGQKCKVRAEAYPDHVYMADVRRILPVADRAKGAVQVRIRIAVPADDNRLRPEMGAVVSIFAQK
jgi:RND family efflux transporter MFP subunit